MYSEPLLSGNVGSNNNVCWSEPHPSLHKLHQDDWCLAGVSSICAIFGNTHPYLSGKFFNNIFFVSNCILQEKLRSDEDESIASISKLSKVNPKVSKIYLILMMMMTMTIILFLDNEIDVEKPNSLKLYFRSLSSSNFFCFFTTTSIPLSLAFASSHFIYIYLSFLNCKFSSYSNLLKVS